MDFRKSNKISNFLIKERFYGYGSNQFYNVLSQEQIDLIDDLTKEISFEKAEEIFNAKNYEDPSMRGRQSINPLKKIGLVLIKDGKVLHPTQKPEEMLKRIILASSNKGDIVLDPFLGSGTTAYIAKKYGRNWIGIEQDKQYVKIAEERMKK
ncbi:MAG: site-specific DNA-methyltransferase [Candidatus Acididesulfobacter diazotrophicus]|uniref:Methyltransferase n=1 Tax=Candidatus Acididesulfobacter diazotrophicus TaxID=2597226 RepID=A0A519BKD5_9DELT|nr:MAG: site-specific DNA-methyltransferase [Candidatus Acididesulfobacter diazotrophicus]